MFIMPKIVITNLVKEFNHIAINYAIALPKAK